MAGSHEQRELELGSNATIYQPAFQHRTISSHIPMVISRHAPSLDPTRSNDENDLLPSWSNISNPFSLSVKGGAWNKNSNKSAVQGRKRDLDDEGFGNSSDTPLFSSDDNPASVEDYFARRNKRQRRGPWWGHKEQADPPIPRAKAKREFKRNMDSGVWMGSDTAVEDDLNILDVNCTQPVEPLRDLALRTSEEPIRFDGPVFPYWEEQPTDPDHFWSIQKAAAMRIGECIDDGKDTVDLSNFGLTKLQGSIIEPLQYYFTKHRISHDGQGKFEPFGRDLMIFLSNNMLTQVPARLLQLENLTVLSLRGNKLTELPAAIGNFIHLRELNVSQNNLRWLPYEIRHLLQGQLRLFGFQPNPFLHPTRRYDTDWWQQHHPFCSTKPALLRIDGTLAPRSPPSPARTPEHATGRSQPSSPDQQHSNPQPTHVPSLFEVCLRNLYDSPQLSQLPFLIPHDAPASLVPAAKHTWRLKESGGQRCTVCGKAYVVARAEWIEWWQLATTAASSGAGPRKSEPHPLTPREPFNHAVLGGLSEEAESHALTWREPFTQGVLVGCPVPLLRRVCSWGCIIREASHTSGSGC